MPEKSEYDFRKEIAKLFRMLGYLAQSPMFARGRSGVYHEMDVIAQKAEGVLERFLVIKTKDYREEPILRLDDVLGFWAQVVDIGADRGIIVTTCGTEESAIKFASFYGIRIIEGRGLDELRRKAMEHEVYLILKDLGESPVSGS